MEFLSGRSGLTNLLSVKKMVTKAKNVGSDVDICFLDFSRTFDPVNPRIIYAKLTAIRVSDRLVIWIRNYIAARTFQMRMDDALSNKVTDLNCVDKVI